MPKINIKVTVGSNENKDSYKIKAIMNEEKIIYHEKDEKNTKVIFDWKNNLLIRNNSDILMTYPFDLNNKTIGNIEVKELNKYLNLSIETIKYDISDIKKELKFKVEDEEIIYIIEVLKWVLLKI